MDKETTEYKRKLLDIILIEAQNIKIFQSSLVTSVSDGSVSQWKTINKCNEKAALAWEQLNCAHHLLYKIIDKDEIKYFMELKKSMVETWI